MLVWGEKASGLGWQLIREMSLERIYLTTVVCLVALSVGGCGNLNYIAGGNTVKDARQKLVWSYEKESIVVIAESQRKLNQFSGDSHTLAILIVQTKDMNQLTKINTDQIALGRILSGECDSSLLAVDRFFLAPSCKKTYIVDRAQDAQYVGVFAGYFEKPSKGFGKFFEIGTEILKDGKVVKTYTVKPKKLIVKMGFGAGAIDRQEMLAADFVYESKDVCVQ